MDAMRRIGENLVTLRGQLAQVNAANTVALEVLFTLAERGDAEARSGLDIIHAILKRPSSSFVPAAVAGLEAGGGADTVL